MEKQKSDKSTEFTYPPISVDSSLQEINFFGPAPLRWQSFDYKIIKLNS